MEISQLMSAIRSNLNVPIRFETVPKLPVPFQSLTEDDLGDALTLSYRRTVEQRGNLYEDITSSEISQKIRGAIAWMKAPPKRCCLLLQGVPGTGKTTLLWAIYSMISMTNTSMLYTSAQKLFEYYSLLLSGTSVIYNEYKTEKRLFIDDLGAEPTRCLYYGVEYLPIQEVLTYRYERQLPTIITTNLSDSMIRDRYGDRISDRFAEMCTILRFSGHSYRK